MAGPFNARQKAILSQIRQEGRVLVEDLAAAFGTTPQTIRRDLRLLEETGEVMRFHGGASLLPGTEYTSFEIRRTIQAEAKERIGRAVAARIPDNTMLMINGGTTTAAFARALAPRTGLRIITDNLEIANDLRSIGNFDLMVPGGTVRRSDGTVTGAAALEFLRGFRADIAVIGAAAVDSDGALLDFDLAEAAVARTMMECAKHVILAVDSTKFDRSAPVVVGWLRQVNTLVTDRCRSERIRALCDSQDVELVESDPIPA